ncbi:hypothetical protein Salmuc_00670 [Salipiger mucosus DSM 16094]|uniref:Uncharacterized protein n=1 Tax=Salipiger mucosus DSM 16094 TaxID=1123237 RepID=S9QZQ3_9RHOB|nr:hypothetical protein Salmuc_00670 [Salipiger mucosus DSM 16094]
MGAALGAARLGRVAATGAAPAEVMTPPETGEVIEPVAELVPAFDAAWQRFGPAYRGVKAIQ